MDRSINSSRSNNSNQNPKEKGASTDEAIVQNLFSKTAQIVVQARIDLKDKEKENGKSNKWFNLDTPDIDPLRSELKFWKTLIGSLSNQQQQQQQQPMMPLILDIYLDIADLDKTNQFLVLKDEVTLRRAKVPSDALMGSSMDPISGEVVRARKKRILLESWQLTLGQTPPRTNTAPETAIMYKQCVIFFRSLYTHIRLLPAYRLSRRLSKLSTSNYTSTTANPLKIGYRLSASRVMPIDEAGLGDQLLAASSNRQGISEYNFGSLDTSIGTVNLHVMYRVDCDFTVSDPVQPIDEYYAGYVKPGSSVGSNHSLSGSVNRRISAPIAGLSRPTISTANTAAGPFGNASGNSGRVNILSSSPRSFGAGTRASLPNALVYQQTHHSQSLHQHQQLQQLQLGLPVPVVMQQRTSGSMGVSPAFTLSGSFPRSHNNGKSGLTDAIAMGLFDGAQQGLPFSVKRSGDENVAKTSMDSDRKSLEDIFSGMEESPPFNVFLSKDVGRVEYSDMGFMLNVSLNNQYPKYGTSISSNHSGTSAASLSQRQSITFPRSHVTTTIPFTNTILHRTPATPANNPFPKSTNAANALIPRGSITSNNSSGIPSSTPPRAPFSTSLSHTSGFNPQIMATHSALPGFGAQTPPPFVTMTNLGASGRRISSEMLGVTSFGSTTGNSASIVSQQQAGSVVGELGEFLKNVENRRRGLIPHQQQTQQVKSKIGGGMEGSDSSAVVVHKKKQTPVNKNQALSKFKQLKDSYHDFSNSLTVATDGSADALKLQKKIILSGTSSGTPPPVVFSNSPPSLGGSVSHYSPAVLGTSPKSESNMRAHSPLAGEPFTNPVSLAFDEVLVEKPRKQLQNQQQQGIRRPSSLQQVTVLSTVLSDSGSGGDFVDSNVGVATIPATSPISEEAHANTSAQSFNSRDKHPQIPPAASGVPSVVHEPVGWPAKRPHRGNVFTADPARISSGFFPVGGGNIGVSERSISDKTSWSGGNGIDEQQQRVHSPLLAIEPLGGGSVGGVPVPASSTLSTSLRSTLGITSPGLGGFGGGNGGGVGSIPPRALSAERPLQQTQADQLTRRNSSGGNLAVVGGGLLQAPAAISEGGGNTGRIGKMGARFGSAPVEVPFGKRVGSEIRRVENVWDQDEEEEED
ncbi:UNVERIFIED_CONTAM: autophagy protein 13 [Siphonaria sp. JEL0065]|nr:autophagy protein 13 [Siphonaria sp. JEL0065]